MSAHDSLRITLTAVGFAVAMLLLGLLNPNAVPGRSGCGLVCDAQVAAPLMGLSPR
jgi:hypothetical protein